MRIIANFHKGEALRFISHLDVQRLLQRALRRAKLPVRYSQGFNPHPLLSCASALSVGYTSDAEWMDVRLDEDIRPEDFISRMNAVLPEGLRVINAMGIDENVPTLTALLRTVEYEVHITLDAPADEARYHAAFKELLGGEIIVTKRTKGGMKQVDIRPMLVDIRVISHEGQAAVLLVDGILNASGGLPMELLIQAFLQVLGTSGRYTVHRTSVQFNQIEV